MPRLSTTTRRSVGWMPPGSGSFGFTGVLRGLGAVEVPAVEPPADAGEPEASGTGTVGVISSGRLGTAVMVGVAITRSTTPHPPRLVSDPPTTTHATTALTPRALPHMGQNDRRRRLHGRAVPSSSLL